MSHYVFQLFANFKYEVAVFNHAVASDIHSSLRQTEEVTKKDYSREAFKAAILKVEIEDHLCETMRAGDVSKLKGSLNVLFSFERRLVRDKQFSKDVRHWIAQLVAAIERKTDGTADDNNLYFLNHVLRCPPGFGRWAAHFIQPRIPESSSSFSLNDKHMDQLLAILATMMLPIRERERFLVEFKIDASPATVRYQDDNKWTVIDSEGDTDCLAAVSVVERLNGLSHRFQARKMKILSTRGHGYLRPT